MNHIGKILAAVIVVAVIIAVGSVSIKLLGLVSGAVSGIFNLILGVAVVIALIVIVGWMFSYAKRK